MSWTEYDKGKVSEVLDRLRRKTPGPVDDADQQKRVRDFLIAELEAFPAPDSLISINCTGQMTHKVLSINLNVNVTQAK